MPISNILHCEGVPDGPCSMNASGDIVQLCQGDLVLCPYCKEVRFPSNIATQTDVISSMPSSVNTRRKNNDHKLILNPLLAYVISSMHSGSNDNIKHVVSGHFCASDITTAKNDLWDHCDTNIIGEKQKRKDSSSRSEKDANIQDILHALTKLDNINKIPPVAIPALDLHKIPRFHPEEFVTVSVLERLLSVENKLKNLQDSVDISICGNLQLKDKVEEKISYANAVISAPSNTNNNTTIVKATTKPKLYDKEKTNKTEAQPVVNTNTNPTQVSTTEPVLPQAESIVSLGVIGDTTADSEGYRLPTDVIRKQQRQYNKSIMGKATTNSR